MKNITTILLLTIVGASHSVMASTNGLNVPDGGASALLLGMGAVGLVAARRFFGKK